jgi:hypothetical protein
VRYEDLAANASAVASKVFAFLGLSPSIPSVEKFLRLATSGQVKKDEWANPYAVIRDSGSIVNAWRGKITRELVDSVQSSCGGVMKALGYARVNPREFPSGNSTFFGIAGP